MGTLLGDKDLALFDHVAREINLLAGTVAISYFALKFEATKRDPLYKEPLQEIHIELANMTGVPFKGLIEYPERSYRTGEEGKRIQFDAKLWLARADFQAAYPVDVSCAPPGTKKYREPRIGDVVMVQDRYYDTTSIDLEGQLNDTEAVHTMFVITLKNRTEYDPRRRLEGQR